MISNFLKEESTCGSGIRGVNPLKNDSPRVSVDQTPSYEVIFDCIDNEIFSFCNLDYLMDGLNQYCKPSYLTLCDDLDFHEQSEDIDAPGTTEATPISEVESTTIGFLEAPNRYTAGFNASMPSTAFADVNPDISLNDFLKRPVAIYSTTWAESDTVTTTRHFDPWNLYLANSIIRNKLNNYAYIRFDLKLKFMVNASPFYYGAMLVAYQPLYSFHAGGIPVTYNTRQLINYSQRPHLWIYPQNNEGGELTLPFLREKPFIRTISSLETSNMGGVDMLIASVLQSANGASGTGVSVVVYAWAENVILSGPSIGLTLQSDEYGKGPVSSVASAIAGAARSLSRIPLIRPYATATQMGASAIASIASTLGFSNPPVISDTMPYRPAAFPVMAATEQSFPIEKLTVDPKNEFSVDPSISGIPAEDELNIVKLITHESYLTKFSWTSSNNVDDILFSSAVAPHNFDADANANPTMYMTPLCWIANLFQYWRGDIIFRFRFIASQYHRGRVRISYDPQGNATTNIYNTSVNQAAVFNEVVDLTKDTNVEVRVPYSQALSWCKTAQPSSNAGILWSTSATPTFNHTELTTNGCFTIRVTTILTAPIASSSIDCLVSVRAAENLELAAPHAPSLQNAYSYFAPQSEEFELQSEIYDATPAQAIIAGHAPSYADPNRYLVNMGEQIVSLRQLLRRYNYVTTVNASQSTTYNYFYWSLTRLPVCYGYDPTGLWSAKGLITTGSNFPFNYVGVTMLSYIYPAFIGQRGSVNWTFNQHSANSCKWFQFARYDSNHFPSYGSGTLGVASASIIARDTLNSTTLYQQNAGGMTITNQDTQTVINTALPMYSAYVFNSTDPSNATSPTGADDTTYQLGQVLATWDGTVNSGIRVSAFCAIGTDFSLVFFLNVPVIYRYSSIPNA